MTFMPVLLTAVQYYRLALQLQHKQMKSSAVTFQFSPLAEQFPKELLQQSVLFLHYIEHFTSVGMHLFTDYYFYSYCRVVWSKLPNAGKQRCYAILSPSVRPEKLTLYLHAGPRDNISITGIIWASRRYRVLVSVAAIYLLFPTPEYQQGLAWRRLQHFSVSLDCLELSVRVQLAGTRSQS